MKSATVDCAIAFAGCVLVSIAAFGDALSALAALIASSDEYSLIALAPLITLGLIVRQRDVIFGETRSDPRSKILAFATAAVAFLALLAISTKSPNEIRLTTSILLLVSLWIFAFRICFGAVATRRAAFPLLFLFFLAPLPSSLMDRLVTGLQYASAEVTGLLFAVAGVPVLRHDQTFALANLEIEIARECSGIRSAMGLVMLSAVFSHLFLRSSWSRAALLLLTVPLAIIKNGLRIFTLSTLAAYVDPAYLNGPPHRYGGVIFFGIAFLGLIAFVRLLQLLETHTAQRTSRAVLATAAIRP